MPPTPTHALARNGVHPQIRALLSVVPAPHPRVRHRRQRLPAPATLSHLKTRSAARQNENASPPSRGPAPGTDIFRGETHPGCGVPPQAGQRRQEPAASMRLHETHAGSGSAALSPAGEGPARPLQPLEVQAWRVVKLCQFAGFSVSRCFFTLASAASLNGS